MSYEKNIVLDITSVLIHCFIVTILFCRVKNDHTHQAHATTSFMTNENNFSHSQVIWFSIFFLSFPLFCSKKNTDQDSERKTI